MWHDCLLSKFTHENITLAGDYIIAFLMVLIFLAVSVRRSFLMNLQIMLLFYGIMTISPSLLVPHLVVQAICLLSSFLYFVVYAWSYFHGDMHTQRRNFKVSQALIIELKQCILQLQAMVERMWLASMIVILAGFQLYLFFSVIRCCLYLQASVPSLGSYLLTVTLEFARRTRAQAEAVRGVQSTSS
jgi:hypothetical protein